MWTKSSVVPYAVSTLIGSWVASTLVAQISPPTYARIAKVDPFGSMIPNWRFFAPNPAKHDYRVAYRCLYHDGTEGTWDDSEDCEPRKWTHGFWFPDRRRNKAISDTSSNLLRAISANRYGAERSAEYQLLCQWIKKVAVERSSKPVEGVQFSIARDPGFDDNDYALFLFISRLERIGTS